MRGDRDQQVTSVHEFVLGDGHDAADFEAELDRLVLSHSTRKGLRHQVVLRSLDRPGAYLLLGCWQTSEQLVDAIHADAVCARFHQLGRLAEVTPGQAVTVGLMAAGLALAEAAHALLIGAVLAGSSAAFEMQFGELVGTFLHDPGFGGGLLLRSTLDPRVYHGLIWWSSAQSCEDAVQGDHFLRCRRRLQRLTSQLTFEGAQFVREDA
ncbi:hypothetical protein AAW14_27445 [Streptomyces hygroscopicus]|nr:hypothetical protein [Streptomyces hygroscopicus]